MFECIWSVISLSAPHMQIERETAQSMQKLVDLDRVKTRMQESADALQVGGGCCRKQHSVTFVVWSMYSYMCCTVYVREREGESRDCMVGCACPYWHVCVCVCWRETVSFYLFVYVLCQCMCVTLSYCSCRKWTTGPH